MSAPVDLRQDWLTRRSCVSAPGDLDLARRLRGSTTCCVVVPARNEVATVGALVEGLRAGLDDLVDEVVVVDDGSDDGTGAAASRAGARVVDGRDPEGHTGKGGAMWRGLAATTAELVVFLDADVPDFAPHWVASLLLPMLREPGVALVKAAYDRPLTVDGVVHPGSGGRVTRLVANPLLNLVAPDLTVFAQPLAGETAARRTLLERVSFVGGYGVELGLLLDAHRAVGLDGLAQVDLGVRWHRHHSDVVLAEMATTLLQVAAHRTGCALGTDEFARVRRDDSGTFVHEVRPLRLSSLPPPGTRHGR